jgi:NADP-dependent 3-hydroxy acid dehydrogenase YdfG
MSRFTDKTVIVTGAGTGIGRAVAVDFVKEGARVAFVGRRLEKLKEAAAGLPETQAACYACDVADRAAVNAIARQVVDQFGPVDILVNNAGTNTNPRSVAEVDPDDWDRTVAINLTGAFNFVRAVLPGMRERKAGLIINVSSIAGLRASKLSGAAYSASKHGMVALTHSINEEEKDYSIRSCVICPGEVNTPIIDLRPEPVSEERRANMLQPEDVSAAALFVASLPSRVCIPLLVIKPTSQIFS